MWFFVATSPSVPRWTQRSSDRWASHSKMPSKVRRQAAQCIRSSPDHYADLPLGTVDASVIALTERLALPAVATLDHRHFTVVRPRHISALTLLP
jgi:hypothetical protein